jgi:hypothetical protein
VARSAIRQGAWAEWLLGSRSCPVYSMWDDVVSHPAVSYCGYSVLSRKLSTRCMSSVAAPLSWSGRLLSANRRRSPGYTNSSALLVASASWWVTSRSPARRTTRRRPPSGSGAGRAAARAAEVGVRHSRGAARLLWRPDASGPALPRARSRRGRSQSASCPRRSRPRSMLGRSRPAAEATPSASVVKVLPL